MFRYPDDFVKTHNVAIAKATDQQVIAEDIGLRQCYS